MSKDRPRHEIPYLHVRPPRRGGANPGASIVGNRTGLLRLRDHIEAALDAEEGLASMHWSGYREIDGQVFDLMVYRAPKPEQMGEPREPDPPDYSRLT